MMFTFIRSLSAVTVLAFVGATALHPSSRRRVRRSGDRAGHCLDPDEAEFGADQDGGRRQDGGLVPVRAGLSADFRADGRPGPLGVARAQGHSPGNQRGGSNCRRSDPVALTLLVDDVDREVEALQAKGVEIVSEPRDELTSRFRVSRIYDEGHRVVELREPLGSGEAHFGHQEF